MDNKLRYQASVCNNAILSTLLALKSSGLEDEDLKIMLDLIGRTLVKMRIENKPIDFYISHITNFNQDMQKE